MGEAGNAPFEGANALIFGGAKGIGKSVALEWAKRGANIAIADIDEAAAIETAAEIEDAGGHAIGVCANVLSEESIADAVAAVEGQLGEIDIVMNNVGAILNGHPEDVPFAEWQRILDLNYLAIIRSNAIFIPKMLARGAGHIVNTASFAGMYPYALGRMPYASAKAATISLSENLAIYLEPKGVRVSCLVPGPTVTAITDGMKTWTDDVPLYAGGSELTLIMPDQLARTLADGMRDGRIIIPADDIAFEISARKAANPDAFIREKIASFAIGDEGRPTVPPELAAMLAGMQ